MVSTSSFQSFHQNYLKFLSFLNVATFFLFVKLCEMFRNERENFVKSAAKNLAKFGIDFAKISYFAKSDIIIS